MKNQEYFDQFRASWPSIPAVGPTGSAFVAAEIEAQTGDRVVEYHRPSKPQQEYEELAESGWVKLTDAEYAARLAGYEKLLAEYRRTGGRAVIIGTPTVRGEFTCADGTWCEGVGDRKTWQWTRTETKGSR